MHQSPCGETVRKTEIIALSHRGHYSLDSGCRQLLPFGLLNHRDPEILQLEHHPLHQSLPGVCPVLWKL